MCDVWQISGRFRLDPEGELGNRFAESAGILPLLDLGFVQNELNTKLYSFGLYLVTFPVIFLRLARITIG